MGIHLGNLMSRLTAMCRRIAVFAAYSDEVVTRRDTLRFLLAGSGALFLATGVLAILGNLPVGQNVKAVPVAKVGELAENEWRVFDFPDQYAQGSLSICRGRAWWPTAMFAHTCHVPWPNFLGLPG